MNRREALRQAGLAAGAAALWATLPARTWAALAAPSGSTAGEEALANLIGDTILPTTASSPGAGTVGIGRFILTQVSDCFPPESATLLRSGLAEIEAESRRRFTREFAAISVADREALLVAYEAAPRKGPHPFRLLKEPTLLGYFTSEAGATTALRYESIPGAYHGSIPLGPTDRSWAL